MALVLGCLVSVGEAQGAAPQADVISRTVTTTTHDPGFPTTSDPARTIAKATINQDILASVFSGTVSFAADPSSQHSTIHVLFGTLNASGDCTPNLTMFIDSTNDENASVSGSDLTFRIPSVYGDNPYNCAGVGVEPWEEDGMVDLVSGDLIDVRGVANLAVTTKRLKLARGETSLVQVKLVNRGTSDATGAVVTGSGKGYRIMKTVISTVDLGTPASVWVPVKLTGEKTQKIAIAITAFGRKTISKVKVTTVKRPAKPKAGGYRGSSGTSFEVIGGKIPKIVNFRGSVEIECPDQSTPGSSGITAPNTRIWGNGQVVSLQSKALFSVSMQMKVIGRKAVKGELTYAGPAGCFGTASFSAKRG